MKVYINSQDDFGSEFNTESLVTSYDAFSRTDDYVGEQFKKGQKLVADGYEMHISESGVWSASHPSRLSFISSYEKIGYHAHTKPLIEGFLEAGGKLTFHGFRGINGSIS